MTNSFITASIIAKESLFQLRNNVVFLNLVHRDYKKEFVKVGDTISIRKPVKFESNDGAVLVKQSVQEGTTPFVIQNRKHIGWGFLTSDLTLTVADYAERYLNPAGIKLGNDVDVSLAQLYKQLWLSAGTPGTTPASFSALGDLATIMDDNAIPDDGKRRLVFNPAARWSMADALKALAALPDHGQSLLPSYASGTNSVPYDMIAQIHKGERIIPAGMSGESGQPINVTSYITIEGDATERTVEMIRKAVRDEAETALRKAAFRGSYVTSGAYTAS